MLAPDAKHMHVDATDGKTYHMALVLVRPLERQFGQEKPVKVNIWTRNGSPRAHLHLELDGSCQSLLSSYYQSNNKSQDK